jgi:protein-tyrosine phosphatase
MIDIHSHILHGVDDGAKTLSDSVAVVRELVGCGVTDIIATPHYVEDTRYTVERKENLALLKGLREKLVAENIDVNIYLGNELYISENILQWLKKGVVSPLSDSKYLLVELPLNGEYQNYEDLLLELIQFGYKVILAHPERYEIFKEDYSLLVNLWGEGVLLQCNIGSFVGKYGREALKLARRLAKDKRIFALGSDIHHCSRNDFIMKAQKKLAKFYSDTEIEELLVGNPSKILEK